MSFGINDSISFPKRRVHLDFHTSPLIANVGSGFDKKQFQKALKDGHANSITVFAKCHHGYCYYPTEVGTMHPNLDFDLTAAMIDAAHEIGVSAPIYITAGWSQLDSEKHPEWICRKADGSISAMEVDLSAGKDEFRPYNGWIDMCLNDGAYCEHIYALTEEVCKRYSRVDGLFYDICFVPKSCRCKECTDGMRGMGFDPDNEEDAKKYYELKHIAFMQKCKAILDKYHPGATVFFNSGGADPYKPAYHPYSTHFEMEDLPTYGGGGYNKMPVNAKFFSRTGKPYLGMTGKFHLTWGEFGGFKPKEALRYEVCNMALYGAGCSIGDQLFPDGVMDEQTYKNIGYAYEYLEAIEPYCYNGESTAKLGVVLSKKWEITEGVVNCLIESQVDFEIITDNIFAPYDTVILPCEIEMDGKRLEAITNYLKNGGKVLAVGDSIIKDGEFLLDCGLKNPINAPFDCDYILPRDRLSGDIPRTPFLSNLPAYCAETEDAEVYAEILHPYFSRTYGHFCGHRDTPYNKSGKRYAALAKKDGLVWLAHDIPRLYVRLGCVFHKRYFISALELLFDNPCAPDLPSNGRSRLICQADKRRYCLNMTYAVPNKRGAAEIIDEIVPLYDISVKIRLSERVKKVHALIADNDIEFEQRDDILKFKVGKLQLHECIIIEY